MQNENNETRLLGLGNDHGNKAIYMAKRNDMDAIAYNAANTTILRWRIIMFFRERASRVKAVMCG